MSQENSEVSTRQLQAVCLEINCLVEHLDRALAEKDLTYIDVFYLGPKGSLTDLEKPSYEEINLEHELGAISSSIGYIKGHCKLDPRHANNLLYVLEVLRNAITVFEIPTDYYLNFHFKQFIDSVEEDIHDAVTKTNWISQDFADKRIRNLRDLSIQLKSLINEESEKQVGEALVDYLLEKNYFQTLLWPELLQFGLVQFSWTHVAAQYHTLLIGVKNDNIPFLAHAGNIGEYLFRFKWGEDSRPGLPDWISFDTYTDPTAAVNMNVGPLVDIDSDFGMPAMYAELFEIKNAKKYPYQDQFYYVYEAFLVQACAHNLTKAGEDEVTEAYEWMFGSEDDSTAIRNIELSNDFSFDNVPTWSKIPKSTLIQLTDALINYFSYFSTPLTYSPFFHEWKQEFVANSINVESTYKSRDFWDLNDSCLFNFSRRSWWEQNVSGPLPEGTLFKGDNRASWGDISNHLAVENLLCLISLHPNTPVEIIQKLKSLKSPNIQQALAAIKEDLI